MQSDPMFFVKIKQRMIQQHRQKKDITMFYYNMFELYISRTNTAAFDFAKTSANIHSILNKYGNFWISDPGTGAEACWIYDNGTLANEIAHSIVYDNNHDITLCLVKVDPDTDKYFFDRVCVLDDIRINFKEKAKDIL